MHPDVRELCDLIRSGGFPIPSSASGHNLACERYAAALSRGPRSSGPQSPPPTLTPSPPPPLQAPSSIPQDRPLELFDGEAA